MLDGRQTMLGKSFVLAMLVAASLTLSGCAATRIAYTESEQAVAEVPDIADARFWADDHDTVGSFVAQGLKHLRPGQFSLLALSGGGANGAYGAGFLTGWTRAGSRPEFSVVTGVSVGALIAPFAFIGPERDSELAAMFTSGEAKNLMEPSGLEILFGSGAYSAEPLKKLVEAHVDQDLLADVAAEYNKGRVLLVATTDVDSQRTAIWNMGAIAASTSPGAQKLFQTVLLASASVPGVFEPKRIEVVAGGRRFSELHVDGGVTSNLVLVPEAFLVSDSKVPLGRKPQFYTIVNGKLDPEFKMTETGLINIVERSFETTIKANTNNQLLASRDYVLKRNGNLYITAIDPSYPLGEVMDFGIEQTAPLFAQGFAQGLKAERWNYAPVWK